jgi:hypothetical protein
LPGTSPLPPLTKSFSLPCNRRAYRVASNRLT